MLSVLLLLGLRATGTDVAGGVDAAMEMVGVLAVLACVAILVLWVAGVWKALGKAGEPGWAAIVPGYNFVVLLRIAARPLWWLMLFPVTGLILAFDLARCFGRGRGFALGMILLPFVFYPMLGFGDARYQPPPAA